MTSLRYVFKNTFLYVVMSPIHFLKKDFNIVKISHFKLTMEGTGFQPTIDALFGERGFFPDAISSVMYKAQDNAQMLKDILDRITPDRDRRKRQVKAFLDTSYILCLEIMFYSL